MAWPGAIVRWLAPSRACARSLVKTVHGALCGDACPADTARWGGVEARGFEQDRSQKRRVSRPLWGMSPGPGTVHVRATKRSDCHGTYRGAQTAAYHQGHEG